eukprot:3679341-Pyramimonas_sp.AAC.1
MTTVDPLTVDTESDDDNDGPQCPLTVDPLTVGTRPQEAGGPPSCPARGHVPCRPPLPGCPSLLGTESDDDDDDDPRCPQTVDTLTTVDPLSVDTESDDDEDLSG